MTLGFCIFVLSLLNSIDFKLLSFDCEISSSFLINDHRDSPIVDNLRLVQFDSVLLVGARENLCGD